MAFPWLPVLQWGILELLFDQNLSFDWYIKQVSRTAFFHFWNIAKIRNILSQSDAEKLVHAFVTLRLDHCNSLLLGCPTNSLKSLQLIQNVATRVLIRTNRRDCHDYAWPWCLSVLSCRLGQAGCRVFSLGGVWTAPVYTPVLHLPSLWDFHKGLQEQPSFAGFSTSSMW